MIPHTRVPSDVSNPYGSSILAITAVNGVWFLGGYSSNKGMLLAYNDGILTDYSNLVNGFSYVDWVSNLQVLAFGKGRLWIASFSPYGEVS